MTYLTSCQLKDPRETRAACWLELLGHRPKKIEEDSKRTPDFHVLAKASDEAFYVEVKAIESPGETDILLFDPLFNKVSNRIRDALKQFVSYDPKHNLPRVLLFLSEDFRVNGDIMLDFFSGHITIEDKTIRELKRFRFGRVCDDLREIDLYIILDRSDTPTFFYNKTIPTKVFALQRAFDHVE